MVDRPGSTLLATATACFVLAVLPTSFAVGQQPTEVVAPPRELTPPPSVGPITSPQGVADSPAAQADSPCDGPVDIPLWALTADARPRGKDGAPVSAADQPVNCWEESGRAGLPQLLRPGWGGGFDCHGLVQGARFCHRPLYFDDDPLERRGEMFCPPLLHGASHFLCDFARLPLKLCRQWPNECVGTPTPHCCPPE